MIENPTLNVPGGADLKIAEHAIKRRPKNAEQNVFKTWGIPLGKILSHERSCQGSGMAGRTLKQGSVPSMV
jgi:hypothetical protein